MDTVWIMTASGSIWKNNRLISVAQSVGNGARSLMCIDGDNCWVLLSSGEVWKNEELLYRSYSMGSKIAVSDDVCWILTPRGDVYCNDQLAFEGYTHPSMTREEFDKYQIQSFRGACWILSPSGRVWKNDVEMYSGYASNDAIMRIDAGNCWISARSAWPFPMGLSVWKNGLQLYNRYSAGSKMAVSNDVCWILTPRGDVYRNDRLTFSGYTENNFEKYQIESTGGSCWILSPSGKVFKDNVLVHSGYAAGEVLQVVRIKSDSAPSFVDKLGCSVRLGIMTLDAVFDIFRTITSPRVHTR